MSVCGNGKSLSFAAADIMERKENKMNKKKLIRMVSIMDELKQLGLGLWNTF